MTPDALQRELEARRPDLPGTAVTWDLRQRALAELAATGLPTPRRENWRYTDLQSVTRVGHELLPPPPDAAAVAAAAARLESAKLGNNALRCVLVDGHWVPELGSGTPPAGLELADLKHDWARFVRSTDLLDRSAHPLAHLNTAFARQGVVLRAAPGARISAPVELVFVSSETSGLAPQPRVIIELGEGAELAVVEHFLDVGAPAGWINSVTQVELHRSSRLTFQRLQEHGAQQVHTALVAASLAADAKLTAGFVDLGGRLIRNDVDVCLREPGATVGLFGVFVAGERQHIDDHTRIDHLAAETHSDESFRGIVGSRGRGVFNGKVVVHRNAQRIVARQSNDNLLLGEHAEIDSKPELEIYADDVKCSHGSTVGELDVDHLFYLRSRGVPEPEARELLTTAFAASVLEQIEPEPLRNAILARTSARLRTLAAAPSS